MRFWLVALMIVLLPLRGWMGDAMAAEAMTQHRGASGAHAARSMQPAAAGDAVAAAHADCPGHAGAANASAQQVAGPAVQAAADAATNAAPEWTADCGACAKCQVCHSVLLAPAEPPVVGALAVPQAAAAAVTAFASAELFRDAKPPIS